MELLYLLQQIKKRKIVIVVITLLFTAVGVFYYYLQPTKYEASMLFYVKRQVQESSDKYYTYDGYYASQVGKEYSDTVVGFFGTIDVLKRAGEITTFVEMDPEKLNALLKNITVSKEAPQLVRVSVTRKDETEAKEVVKAVGQAGIERVKLLNQTGDPYLSVDVVDPEPIVLPKTISIVILGLSGFMSGLLVSLVVILFLDIKKKL